MSETRPDVLTEVFLSFFFGKISEQYFKLGQAASFEILAIGY
jgi:hypothetical protein